MNKSPIINYLLQDQATIGGDQESENKPEQQYFNNNIANNFTQAHNAALLGQSTQAAAINLDVSTINGNVSKINYINVVLDQVNYYYFVNGYELHGLVATLDLKLDIGATYLISQFDSQNLQTGHTVFYNQATGGCFETNLNHLDTWRIGSLQTVPNFQPQKLATINGIGSSQSTNSTGPGYGQLNGSSFVQYLYAVISLQSAYTTSNTNSGYIPITGLAPLCSNNTALSGNIGSITPVTQNGLITKAGDEVLHGISLPFSINDLWSISDQNGNQLGYITYESMTGNSSMNNGQEVLVSSWTSSALANDFGFTNGLNSYFVTPNGADQSAFNTNFMTTNLQPGSLIFLSLIDYGLFIKAAASQNLKNSLAINLGSISYNQASLFNFLFQGQPFFAAYYEFGYAYNNQEVNFNALNFMSLQDMLESNINLLININYPGISMSFLPASTNTSSDLGNAVNMFNTAQNNMQTITFNTELPSITDPGGQFANGYKKIINNASTLRNMNVASSALSGLNFVHDILHPDSMFDIANQMTHEFLDYQDSYGSAAKYAQQRASRLNSAVAAPNELQLLFTNFVSFLNPTDFAKTWQYIDLYGYQLQFFRDISKGYQFESGNYIKWSCTKNGINSFINIKEIALAAEAMLAKGVRIWLVSPYYNDYYLIIDGVIDALVADQSFSFVDTEDVAKHQVENGGYKANIPQQGDNN